jgi:hypothetical protein
LFTAHYLLAGGAPPTEWSAETRVRAIDVGGEAGVIMTKNDYGSGLEDATAGWCYDNSLKMTTNVAVYALRKACQ